MDKWRYDIREQRRLDTVIKRLMARDWNSLHCLISYQWRLRESVIRVLNLEGEQPQSQEESSTITNCAMKGNRLKLLQVRLEWVYKKTFILIGWVKYRRFHNLPHTAVQSHPWKCYVQPSSSPKHCYCSYLMKGEWNRWYPLFWSEDCMRPCLFWS